MEVDFVVGSKLAIEVKSSKLVQDKHLKGLRALMEENLIEKYFVVSFDSEQRRTNDGIEILPWKIFCERLWNAQLITSTS